MAAFPVLDATPLFTLTRAVPEPVSLGKIFVRWPADQSKLLSDAQAARETLVTHCKNEKAPVPVRLDSLNRYLPLAAEIERVRGATPTVQVHKDLKIKWQQTPIVITKYQERRFGGDYWSVEVLHLVWLKAILQLDNAALLFRDGNREGAVLVMREVAGIFQYLASGPARGDVPVEFQPAVFNAMMNLALGQAYALIANKGEGDNLPPGGMGKLCFTIFAAYTSALESLQAANPKGLVHPQFISWLTGVKGFYHAAAALFLAFACKAKDETGQAVGLIRLAISELTRIPKLDSHNKKLNEPAAALGARAAKVEPEWTSENFRVFNKVVPSVEDTDLYLAKTCTMMPNLPQPVPFVMPSVTA
jgi:hypothetical protein